MHAKTVTTLMLAVTLFAASQLVNAGNAQAGAEVDLRALLSEPSRKNLDNLLNSNNLDFLNEGNRNGNGSIMERIESKCTSLKKENGWDAGCDWKDLKLR